MAQTRSGGKGSAASARDAARQAQVDEIEDKANDDDALDGDETNGDDEDVLAEDEIVDEAVIILVIEKKLRNDRCCAGVDFLLQKIQIGSAAVGSWMDFRKAGHPD